MSKHRPNPASYILPCLLLVIAAVYAYLVAVSESQIKHRAVRGVLDLSQTDVARSDFIALAGEWEFYAGELFTPADFRDGTADPQKAYMMEVPGSWHGQEVNGEVLTSKGYATYRLRLKLPEAAVRWGLAVKTVMSAHRLWINGELVTEKGTVGTDRASTKPVIMPDIIQIAPADGEIEILFQVANFSQRKAGLFSQVVLGDYEMLKRWMNREIAIEAILIGCILIMGVNRFIMYVQIRNRIDAFVFGLICLFLGFKISTHGQYILGFFFPRLSDNAFVTLEYICFMAGPPLFALFIYYTFPGLMDKRIRNALAVPGALFLALVLSAPVHIFTQWAIPMQIYTVVTALVLIFYLFLAVRKRLEGAILLSVGASVFFVAFLNDILMNNGTVKTTGMYFSFGLLFMIVCIDIILSYKFANAYHTIDRLSQRLIEQDRVKSEFLANTSHELRTPLNGMIGLAQSLLHSLKGRLTADQELHLNMIVTSGQRLSYLINDILDYSRLNNNDIRLHMTPVNLHQLVHVVLTVVKPLTAGRDLELVNEVSPDLPLVYADEDRMEQIVYNLVGNAIKYTPQGRVTVGATARGDKVEVYVEDTGIGIPEDKFEKIFQPFEQLGTDSNTGVGLGLKITKQLIELHGGSISLASQVGVGSRFSFMIRHQGQTSVPAVQAGNASYETFRSKAAAADNGKSAAQIAAALESLPAADDGMRRLDGFTDGEPVVGMYRILVIDDDAINQQVMVQQFATLPYQVDTLTNGEQALERVDRLHEYDLIVADLMMPGISGLDLCQEIRRKYSLDELPILIMTANMRTETLVAAFGAGANDYIAKPFERNELLSRVQTLILMKRSVQEVRLHAEQLQKLNSQLQEWNANLEQRIEERTMELKRTNETLEERNRELHRLEMARRRLLSDISHELRTPMTAINGYVEAIVSGLVDDPAEQQRYLRTVLGKARSLNRLIQDLFELSRLESRRSEMIFVITPVLKLLEQIRDKFALDIARAGLNYRFDMRFAPEEVQDCQVVIDMDRIIQVLTNLVFNAIKYTPAGGQITIVADRNEEVRVENAVGELVIQVKDTGVGIEPDALPYVFDRFYRQTNAVNGTSGTSGSGIGLAIAKEIVQYHEGVITAASTVGEGSAFTFTLPMYQIDA